MEAIITHENVQIMLDKQPRSFIKEHWGEFVECGIKPNTLAVRCFSGDKLLWNSTEIKFLLEREVEANTVFVLSLVMLDLNVSWPKELRNVFKIMYLYGLPTKTIDGWLKDHVSNELLIQDILSEEGGEAWRKLGIKTSEYAKYAT